MIAPMARVIHIDITLLDPENDQVHMEGHEFTLDPDETFRGFALVTTTEVKKTLSKTKEV